MSKVGGLSFSSRSAVLLALFVGACSNTCEVASVPAVAAPPPVHRVAPRGVYKVGAPYRQAGVLYEPKVDYHYDRVGWASWYGPGFHKRHTANGEIFDQNDLTAAHQTLPLPSVVRVTNLENGRSLIVRINDRGPFVKGRIIDLSKKAARLLGFKGRGVTRVRVQVLERESREAAAASIGGPPMDGAPNEALPAADADILPIDDRENLSR